MLRPVGTNEGNYQPTQEESKPVSHEAIETHLNSLNKEKQAEFIQEGILRTITNPEARLSGGINYFDGKIEIDPYEIFPPEKSNESIPVESIKRPRVYLYQTRSGENKLVVNLHNSETDNPAENTVLVATFNNGRNSELDLSNSLVNVMSQAEYNDATYRARVSDGSEPTMGRLLKEGKIPPEIDLPRDIQSTSGTDLMTPEIRQKAVERANSYLQKALISGEITNDQYYEQLSRINGRDLNELNDEVNADISQQQREQAERYHQEVIDEIFGERYQKSLETGLAEIQGILSATDVQLDAFDEIQEKLRAQIPDIVRKQIQKAFKDIESFDDIETIKEKSKVLRTAALLAGMTAEEFDEVSQRAIGFKLASGTIEEDPEKQQRSEEAKEYLSGIQTNINESRQAEMDAKKQQIEEEQRKRDEEKETRTPVELTYEENAALNEIVTELGTYQTLIEDTSKLMSRIHRIGIKHKVDLEGREKIARLVMRDRQEILENREDIEQFNKGATIEHFRNALEMVDDAMQYKFPELSSRGINEGTATEFRQRVKQLARDLNLTREQRDYVTKMINGRINSRLEDIREGRVELDTRKEGMDALEELRNESDPSITNADERNALLQRVENFIRRGELRDFTYDEDTIRRAYERLRDYEVPPQLISDISHVDNEDVFPGLDQQTRENIKQALWAYLDETIARGGNINERFFYSYANSLNRIMPFHNPIETEEYRPENTLQEDITPDEFSSENTVQENVEEITPNG